MIDPLAKPPFNIDHLGRPEESVKEIAELVAASWREKPYEPEVIVTEAPADWMKTFIIPAFESLEGILLGKH